MLGPLKAPICYAIKIGINQHLLNLVPGTSKQFYKVYTFVAISQTRKLTQRGKKVAQICSNTADFCILILYPATL